MYSISNTIHLSAFSRQCTRCDHEKLFPPAYIPLFALVVEYITLFPFDRRVS
jgi:hypothetical protein